MYTLKSKFYSIIKNKRKMVLTGLTVDSNALNTANGSLKKKGKCMRGSIKILLTIDLWLGTSEIKRTFSNKVLLHVCI